MSSYQVMHQKFLNNEITIDEWRAYCADRLYDQIMKDIAIFKRLKDK